MVISMFKIRRPLGRLIFNMGIAVPGKTVFLIETAHWVLEYHLIPDFFNILTSHGNNLFLSSEEMLCDLFTM